MEQQTLPLNQQPPSSLRKTFTDQKLLYEIDKETTQSIINYQNAYVKYLILILVILVLLFILYEIKKILKMRKLKLKYASLINFIDGIQYHLSEPPVCIESNRYTKTDGLTLVYYYEYPHSFMNPFRNTNFPSAVVISYYSKSTNVCFSLWGDYVGLMLNYSELDPTADAATIICHSGWTTTSCNAEDTSGCAGYCCPLVECDPLCQPYYQESLADIINNATLNAAGAGFVVGGTIKGGQWVYTGLNPQEIPDITRLANTSTDSTEAITQLSEQAAKPFANTSMNTAETFGSAVNATTETGAVVGANAATDVAATSALATTETVSAGMDATVIAAPVGIAIGVVAAIGFGVWMGLKSRNKKEAECEQTEQDCVPTDNADQC